MAEKERFLPQDGPVLLAEADELFVLELVIAKGGAQLVLRLELLGGLLLGVLDEHERLRYPIQLVLQHDDALEVYLHGQGTTNRYSSFVRNDALTV